MGRMGDIWQKLKKRIPKGGEQGQSQDWKWERGRQADRCQAMRRRLAFRNIWRIPLQFPISSVNTKKNQKLPRPRCVWSAWHTGVSVKSQERGAESTGAARPLPESCGTATPSLWGWAPAWTWAPHAPRKHFGQKLLLASCQQDHAFLSVEMPWGRGTRKSQTIFTTNCADTWFVTIQVKQCYRFITRILTCFLCLVPGCLQNTLTFVSSSDPPEELLSFFAEKYSWLSLPTGTLHSEGRISSPSWIVSMVPSSPRGLRTASKSGRVCDCHSESGWCPPLWAQNTHTDQKPRPQACCRSLKGPLFGRTNEAKVFGIYGSHTRATCGPGCPRLYGITAQFLKEAGCSPQQSCMSCNGEVMKGRLGRVGCLQLFLYPWGKLLTPKSLCCLNPWSQVGVGERRGSVADHVKPLVLAQPRWWAP